MKRKVRKIETLLLALFLLGTVFFVPVESVNIKTTNEIRNVLEDEKENNKSIRFKKSTVHKRPPEKERKGAKILCSGGWTRRIGHGRSSGYQRLQCQPL